MRKRLDETTAQLDLIKAKKSLKNNDLRRLPGILFRRKSTKKRIGIYKKVNFEHPKLYSKIQV